MLILSQSVLIFACQHYDFCLYMQAEAAVHGSVGGFEMSPLKRTKGKFCQGTDLHRVKTLLLPLSSPLSHMADFSQSMVMARYIKMDNSYSLFISLLENHHCAFSFNLYFISDHHKTRDLFLVPQQKFNLAGSTVLKDYSKVATTWPKSSCFKLIYSLAIANCHLSLGLGVNTQDRDGYLSMGYLFMFLQFTDAYWEDIFIATIIAYTIDVIWICNCLITPKR